MSFFKDFKAEILKAVIGIIVVFLIAKFDYVVSIFDKGQEIEAQTEFEANLKTAFDKEEIASYFMENEKIVKIFFNSSEVKKNISEMSLKLENEIHNKIVEDVTKSDSNKVSMRSFVGMEAGIRDERVLPILSEMVKDYNEKKIAKKSDVRTLIKKNIKPSALKPAEF